MVRNPGKSNKIGKASKLRNFQYRLLNRILTTNIVRNKWNPQIDKNCTFCKMKSETVIHLICECELVQKMWMALEKWIKHRTGIVIRFIPSLIIMNNISGKHKDILNTLALIMKQYIYAQKCKQEVPNFIEFINRTTQWYQLVSTRKNSSIL